MSGGGTAFGVDLYRLEQVARDHLPTVSTVYDNAIGKCLSAEAAALSSMSQVPEQFQGASGSVSHAYGRLSGAVTDVLKSTKISLDETAEALHKAAMLYAETDQAAADRLKKLFDLRGTPSPELTP